MSKIYGVGVLENPPFFLSNCMWVVWSNWLACVSRCSKQIQAQFVHSTLLLLGFLDSHSYTESVRGLCQPIHRPIVREREGIPLDILILCPGNDSILIPFFGLLKFSGEFPLCVRDSGGGGSLSFQGKGFSGISPMFRSASFSCSWITACVDGWRMKGPVPFFW